jgi:hypothetical protein
MAKREAQGDRGAHGDPSDDGAFKVEVREKCGQIVREPIPAELAAVVRAAAAAEIGRDEAMCGREGSEAKKHRAVISEAAVDEDDGRPLPRFDREEPRPVAFELNFSGRTWGLRSGYRVAYLEWVLGVSGGPSWCRHDPSVHPHRLKQQLTSFEALRSDAGIRAIPRRSVSLPLPLPRSRNLLPTSGCSPRPRALAPLLLELSELEAGEQQQGGAEGNARRHR